MRRLLSYFIFLALGLFLGHVFSIHAQSTETPCPPANLPTKEVTTPYPTATSDMGTKENPVPLGVSVHRISRDGIREYDIVITKLYRGEEAFKLIKQANQTFNDPPEEGKEYILFFTEVAYTKGPEEEALDIDVNYFSTFSENQFLFLNAFIPPSPAFQAKALPGAVIKGWVTKQVFVGDPNALIVWGIDAQGAKGLYFALE